MQKIIRSVFDDTYVVHSVSVEQHESTYDN